MTEDEKKQQRSDSITSAGIGAGAQLAGGLFQIAANKEMSEKERQNKSEIASSQAQAQAAGSLSKGQQNAFGELIDAYKSALIRRK